MLTKTRRTAAAATLAAGLAVAAPLAAQDESPLLHMPDDVMFVFAIENMGELREEWNASPMREAWDSSEFAGIREYALSEWKTISESFEEEMKVSPEEMLGLFDGFVGVFGSTSPDSGIASGGDFRGGLVAEVSEENRDKVRDVIDRLMEELPEDAERSAEEFRGSQIYSVTWTSEDMPADMPEGLEGLDIATQTENTTRWAFTDDYLIISDEEGEPVKRLINALENPDAGRLGAQGDFRSLAGELNGTGDLTFWMDLPAIMRASDAWQDEEARKNLESLGVADVGALLARMDLEDTGITSHSILRMPRERAGLSRALYAGGPNNLNTAQFIPADAWSYYSWTLDVGQLWSTIYETISAMDPQAKGTIDMGLMMASSNFGINLVDDILNPLAGEHASYSRADRLAEQTETMPGMPDIPTSATSTLLALQGGQEAADALNGVMEKLQNQQPQPLVPLESENVQGFTVWGFPDNGQMPAEMTAPRWVATPQFLIIASSMAELQETLRQTGGEGGESLASDPEYQEVLAGVDKENLRLFNYTSREAAESVADQIRFAFDSLAQADPEFPLTADDVPPAEWWRRYSGASVSTIYLSPEFMEGRYDWSFPGE